MSRNSVHRSPVKHVRPPFDNHEKEHRMRTAQLVIAGLIASLSMTALGQTPPPPAAPMRINGTIERLEDRTLTVKTPEGSGDITLPPGLRVTNNRKASLSEIGPNVFIGTTAVLKSDGELHATEVHLFPESMRGTGEGHRPWFADNTTMTNGSVTTMTNGTARQSGTADGSVVLKVSYKGGEKNVHVAPDVPITMIEAGDMSLLKPGTKIVALVSPQADGSAVALMVSVGGQF
jgi:hypothetical protein